MERRFTPAAAASVRLEERDGKKMLCGYASVFYLPNDPGTEFQLYSDLRERIMPTAFDRALREKQDVRCLRNHQPDNVLGRTSAGTCTLTTDKRGLYYETIPDDTTVASDTCKMILRGDVTGSSFAFSVVKQRFVRDGDADIREIHDADISDVGPVTFPAYDSSTAGYRSDLAPAEVRSAYETWREEQAKERARSRVIVPRSVVIAKARCIELDL
jgi:HK97 family phage prohead protease